MDALCSNCRLRPRDYGRRRCGPCDSWYWDHDHTERPRDKPVACRYARPPGERGNHRAYCRAAACGEYGPLAGHGYCMRCYQYWYRHGVERPARLNQMGTPRPCALWWCDIVTVGLIRRLCKRHYLQLFRRGLHKHPPADLANDVEWAS